MPDRYPNCPQRQLHTPGPDGYLEWHAYADRMAATHVQEPCPGQCGGVNWVPATDLCADCRHPTRHHDQRSGCIIESCDCRSGP